ncbi:MAG: LysR family transcriptional regulator [Clostridia bacterium]
MNLYALRIFYHVAKNGSVTRAAEELILSQPAVTAQVRNLEKELGLVLLAPKGRGIFLTNAGEVVAKQAARLFSLENDMEAAIEDYKSGRSGSVKIVATSLPATYILPGWFAQFKRAHADVHIALTTANARAAIEQVMHFQADMAIIGGETEMDGITGELLLEDEFWFVASPSHPLAGKRTTLRTVLKEPFVLREEGSSARECLFALCKRNGVPQPKEGLRVTGLHESIRTIKAGYGVSFVSSLEVQDFVMRNEVVRIEVERVEERNPVQLYVRSNDPLATAPRLFIEMLRNGLKS